MQTNTIYYKIYTFKDQYDKYNFEDEIAPLFAIHYSDISYFEEKVKVMTTFKQMLDEVDEIYKKYQ